MAGRSYSTVSPIQDVRLRKWSAGDVSQIKGAISVLEQQLNTAMAAQRDQGEKPKLSNRIPLVTGLQVRAGYKNFEISYLEAKGIKDLLFYEIQKSETSNFASPISYTIPQTVLTIASDAANQTLYFRVRIRNSRQEVGPWSPVVSATASSNFRISTTRQAASSTQVDQADFGQWLNLVALDYTPSPASVCIQLHAGAYFPITRAGATGAPYVELGSCAVLFRVLRNGVQFAGEMDSGSFCSVSRAGVDQIRTENYFASSMITPFETYDGSEDAVEYIIQVKVLSNTVSPATTPQDITIRIDILDFIEVIQAF